MNLPLRVTHQVSPRDAFILRVHKRANQIMAERVPSSYQDLREFIAYLDKRGQLRRIRAPVSSDLEITAIADRVSKSSDANYALLFENVRGHSIPVLINALGSRARMSW